ncbi:MAG: hypothetical protein R3C44_13705 [Chloroflexota bacterium]
MVSDRELLLNYLVYYGYDGALVAGSHVLDPRSTVPEIAEALSGGGARNLELGFLSGWRVEEMANYLSVTSPAQIDSQQFLDIIQRRQPFDLSTYEFLASVPRMPHWKDICSPEPTRSPLKPMPVNWWR